jgi:hypothetical protein
MKITHEHYEHLRAGMAIKHNDTAYQEYKRNGLSDMRYRWDCVRAAGLMPFICDTLYQYCDDRHIDTALRNITDTH